MKKVSTVAVKQSRNISQEKLTIGLDLGDRNSWYCVLEKHRSAQAQADLMMVRARAGLVRARTGLVNTARGLAKSYGERLRGCNVRNMNPEKAEGLSPELQSALEPLLAGMEVLSEQIREYNERIEKLAQESYPQVALLKQIKGVGTLIALTFLLTLEDPRSERIALRECGWKHGDSGHSAGEQKLVPLKRQQNPLDSGRPSHGRRLHSLRISTRRPGQ